MQDRVGSGRHQYGGRSINPRPVLRSLLRGATQRCPSCGHGALFRRYLKVNNACPHCGEELHHHRADDAPPYFTIVIVGHVIVGLVLAVEMAYRPPLWVHAALWLPLTLILTLLVLPVVKGALVALQWALVMHGFDPEAKEEIGDGLPEIAPSPLPRRLDFRS